MKINTHYPIRESTNLFQEKKTKNKLNYHLEKKFQKGMRQFKKFTKIDSKFILVE